MSGTVDLATGTRDASSGILAKESAVANAGFNRWLVPPAALCIHLCIGSAYGISVLWLPMTKLVAEANLRRLHSIGFHRRAHCSRR